MPRLIAWESHESEPILVIEDLSMHHWSPPWSERQIELTLAQINALHNPIAKLETYAEFIDWNGACLSNPKLDLGFWLPSLAYEAGLEPERILPDPPEVAAWVSGFFAARAGLLEIRCK